MAIQVLENSNHWFSDQPKLCYAIYSETHNEPTFYILCPTTVFEDNFMSHFSIYFATSFHIIFLLSVSHPNQSRTKPNLTKITFSYPTHVSSLPMKKQFLPLHNFKVEDEQHKTSKVLHECFALNRLLITAVARCVLLLTNPLKPTHTTCSSHKTTTQLELESYKEKKKGSCLSSSVSLRLATFHPKTTNVIIWVRRL